MATFDFLTGTFGNSSCGASISLSKDRRHLILVGFDHTQEEPAPTADLGDLYPVVKIPVVSSTYMEIRRLPASNLIESVYVVLRNKGRTYCSIEMPRKHAAGLHKDFCLAMDRVDSQPLNPVRFFLWGLSVVGIVAAFLGSMAALDRPEYRHANAASPSKSSQSAPPVQPALPGEDGKVLKFPK